MRIIHYSNNSGSKEGIYVTEDLKMDASDVCPPGCTVSNDFMVDDEFPSGFPLEYNLERQS